MRALLPLSILPALLLLDFLWVLKYHDAPLTMRPEFYPMSYADLLSKTNELGKSLETDSRLAISDQELVRLCVERGGDEWDGFFLRFTDLLQLSIKSALRQYGDSLRRPWEDEDVLWDIHERLINKFCKKKLLEKCVEPSGIRRWLMTVAANQAIDWLKEKGRLKELPRSQAEGAMRSLNEPVYPDSEITLGETIRSEVDLYHEERYYLEEVLTEIDNFRRSGKRSDNQKYWVIKLSILASLSLQQEEITELSAYSQLAESTIIDKLDKITSLLEQRLAQREAKLGHAVLLWNKARRLEGQIEELKNDNSPATMGKCETLRSQLRDALHKREALLADARKVPRPSNREIAGLIGIPAKKEGQVTTIMQRVRSTLARNDKKRRAGEVDE